MAPNPNDLALALAGGMPGGGPPPAGPPPLPDEAMMAAMLGGGAPPEMGPPPMGPEGMPPIPPELMGLMGGGPPPGMPGMGPMGPPPGGQYPTTDAEFMSQALQQIVQMQDMDHQQMAADQQAALTSNPIFEALVSGAPMRPGAGQDGQAIGPITGEMPEGLPY